MSVSVQEPYCRDDSFAVFYELLNDEHKELFDCVLHCTQVPSDGAALANLVSLTKKHFSDEEDMLKKANCVSHTSHYGLHVELVNKIEGLSVPLSEDTVQFVKQWTTTPTLAEPVNCKVSDSERFSDTFFQDQQLGSHSCKEPLATVTCRIPDPYQWDASFKVFYDSLDEAHQHVFQLVSICADNLHDGAAFDVFTSTIKQHVADEETMMQKADYGDYNKHKSEHDEFVTSLNLLSTPLNTQDITFVKQWLVDHIKTVDSKYKGKL